MTITGKFSATKVKGTGVTKNDTTITAKELHITHSNIWVPLIEVNAIGYLPKSDAPTSGPSIY